jgi:ankyrin repeat protein
LMSAANKGHAEAVRVLVDAGANPATANHQNKTALTFAEAEGHADIVALLQPATEASGTSGSLARRRR